MKEFSMKGSLSKKFILMLVAIFMLGACSTVGNVPNITANFKKNIADRVFLYEGTSEGVEMFILDDGKMRGQYGAVNHFLVSASSATKAYYTNAKGEGFDVVIDGDIVTLGSTKRTTESLDEKYYGTIFKNITSNKKTPDTFYEFYENGVAVRYFKDGVEGDLALIETHSATNATYYGTVKGGISETEEHMTVIFEVAVDDYGFKTASETSGTDHAKEEFIKNISYKSFSCDVIRREIAMFTIDDGDIRNPKGEKIYTIVEYANPTNAIYDERYRFVINTDNREVTVTDFGDMSYEVYDVSGTMGNFYDTIFKCVVGNKVINSEYTFNEDGTEVTYSPKVSDHSYPLEFKTASSFSDATYYGVVEGNNHMRVTISVSLTDKGFGGATVTTETDHYGDFLYNVVDKYLYSTYLEEKYYFIMHDGHIRDNTGKVEYYLDSVDSPSNANYLSLKKVHMDVELLDNGQININEYGSAGVGEFYRIRSFSEEDGGDGEGSGYGEFFEAIVGNNTFKDGGYQFTFDKVSLTGETHSETTEREIRSLTIASYKVKSGITGEETEVIVHIELDDNGFVGGTIMEHSDDSQITSDFRKWVWGQTCRAYLTHASEGDWYTFEYEDDQKKAHPYIKYHTFHDKQLYENGLYLKRVTLSGTIYTGLYTTRGSKEAILTYDSEEEWNTSKVEVNFRI